MATASATTPPTIIATLQVRRMGLPPWGRRRPGAPPSDIPRLVTDEAPRPKVTQRLLDLGPRVHHERPMAGDRFAQGPRGGEDEATSARTGRRLDEVAVAEDHQGGSAHGR